jgi:hypothetical protein
VRESLKNCPAMTQSAVHPKSGDCSISVCVVTSYEATQEPRAPRHAIAIAELIPASRVTLIDCAPRGKAHGDPIILRESLVDRKTIFFPHHRSGAACGVGAKQVNAVVVFDCMEFYSDMGDMQTSVEKAMIRHLESQYLQECDFVFSK